MPTKIEDQLVAVRQFRHRSIDGASDIQTEKSRQDADFQIAGIVRQVPGDDRLDIGIWLFSRARRRDRDRKAEFVGTAADLQCDFGCHREHRRFRRIDGLAIDCDQNVQRA